MRLLIHKAIFFLLLLGGLLPLRAQPAGLQVITSGERKWELLLQDIAGARQTIDLEYYLLADDASGRMIRDALEEKAREGVRVRLLIENVTNFSMRKAYFQQMAEAGIELRYFTDPDDYLWNVLPDLNYRDHRKIVVIDRNICYLGGMNLADHYRLDWRDTHLRLEGPAALQLEQVFLANWRKAGGCPGGGGATLAATPTATTSGSDAGSIGGQPQGVTPAMPSELTSDRCDSIEIVSGGPHYLAFLSRYCQMLSNAQDYVYFQTPYFCPPQKLVEALKQAAGRGIDVRLLIPRKTDHLTLTAANRSFYRELLDAGVRIYEYQPRFDHSKTVVSDDHLTWIGSVNLDCRSLQINYEVAARVEGPALARQQKSTFLSLLDDAHEITLEEVLAWPAAKRLLHRLPRLIRRQL
ncbi:MAG: hypothetical protein IJL93_06550 [Bacteroidales bacterium]|nr:hypothetical protein [Bacteroidales bacterium]